MEKAPSPLLLSKSTVWSGNVWLKVPGTAADLHQKSPQKECTGKRSSAVLKEHGEVFSSLRMLKGGSAFTLLATESLDQDKKPRHTTMQGQKNGGRQEIGSVFIQSLCFFSLTRSFLWQTHKQELTLGNHAMKLELAW